MPDPRYFLPPLPWEGPPILQRFLDLRSPPGWGELLTFTDSKAIPLREAVKSDLLNNRITRRALYYYKIIMGGYYLIAIGRAPSSVVEEVYSIIKEGIANTRRQVESTKGPLEEFVKLLRREMGLPEYRRIVLPTEPDPTYLGAIERLLWIESYFKDFKNGIRIPRVIAIDAAMTLMHYEGSYVAMIIGQGIRGGEVESVTVDVLDVLAGKGTS